MDGQPITFAGSRAAEARSVQHITAHQGREWRSAAPHFDRRLPASLRRDLASLCAAPQTPRRLRCRAGKRLALLVRYDVGRITIVAVPGRIVVAVPRRTVVPATIGLLWSESVTAEVLVFLLVGTTLLRVLKPTGAWACAASCGVLRWAGSVSPLCPTCAPVKANGAARKARERDKHATETRLRGWACRWGIGAGRCS
jgi:hypothetical protein